MIANMDDHGSQPDLVVAELQDSYQCLFGVSPNINRKINLNEHILDENHRIASLRKEW